MNVTHRDQYSAAPSALGYIYQVRYALLESLRRLRKGQDFVVAIETLDDVVFEQDGEAPELLQTKHHVNSAPAHPIYGRLSVFGVKGLRPIVLRPAHFTSWSPLPRQLTVMRRTI